MLRRSVLELDKEKWSCYSFPSLSFFFFCLFWLDVDIVCGLRGVMVTTVNFSHFRLLPLLRNRTHTRKLVALLARISMLCDHCQNKQTYHKNKKTSPTQTSSTEMKNKELLNDFFGKRNKLLNCFENTLKSSSLKRKCLANHHK